MTINQVYRVSSIANVNCKEKIETQDPARHALPASKLLKDRKEWIANRHNSDLPCIIYSNKYIVILNLFFATDFKMSNLALKLEIEFIKKIWDENSWYCVRGKYRNE